MNVRFLRTFIEVANHGNFARAANAVGLTQAAVSMQMRELESLLGVALFDRSKRPAVLSERGQAIVGPARNIVALCEGLSETLVESDATPVAVDFGSVGSMLTGVVSDAITGLRRRFPDLRIRVASGLPADLMAKVEAGELDGALVPEPRHIASNARWVPLFAEPMAVLARQDAFGETAAELLTHNPYIALDRGVWGSRPLDDYLADQGLFLKATMAFDNAVAVVAAVSRGLGVSVLFQGCADLVVNANLRIEPLRDERLTRHLGVLWQSSPGKKSLFAAMVEELQRTSANRIADGLSPGCAVPTLVACASSRGTRSLPSKSNHDQTPRKEMLHADPG